MEPDERLTLTIGLRMESAEAEDLDRSARRLLSEIDDSRLAEARLETAGPAPEGTRSGVLAAVGKVAAEVAVAAVPGLIELLAGWGKSQTRHPVKISISRADGVAVEFDPADISLDEMDAFVGKLMARVGEDGGPGPA